MASDVEEAPTKPSQCHASSGRARTRPDAVLGRQGLLLALEPGTAPRQKHHAEPADQAGHAAEAETETARATRSNPRSTRTATWSSGSFNDCKQWRGLATHYDQLATGH